MVDIYVHNFPRTYTTTDWFLPLNVNAAKHLLGASWDHELEEVVLGMTPDFVAWDDYGLRQVEPSYPLLVASSRDGDGIVTLIDPSHVEVRVPAERMAAVGLGTVNVALSYRRHLAGDERREIVLQGRLPVVPGVV